MFAGSLCLQLRVEVATRSWIFVLRLDGLGLVSYCSFLPQGVDRSSSFLRFVVGVLAGGWDS